MSEEPQPEMSEEPARPTTPDVVAQLVDNHREFLRFLERRVGSRAVAEDILQEAFVRGLDRIGTIRDDESVVAWFYRALRNAVVDHYRRRGASDRALAAFAAELEESVEPDVDTRKVACACVAKLADTLKPEYAAAIRKVEVEGGSLQDLASEAGITPNNAGVRLHRAREALRKRVHASCGTCAEHGCVDCTCAPSG